MTRADPQALARALAMIGKPKEPCPTCGRPPGKVIYGNTPHGAYSAAKACGLDPQVVHRAAKKQRAAQ